MYDHIQKALDWLEAQDWMTYGAPRELAGTYRAEKIVANDLVLLDGKWETVGRVLKNENTLVTDSGKTVHLFQPPAGFLYRRRVEVRLIHLTLLAAIASLGIAVIGLVVSIYFGFRNS